MLNKNAKTDAAHVLMVKDIIVIYRKNETILVLISLETLFFASWKFNT